MAEFHLWSKANLLKFAEDAAAALQTKDDEIAALRVKLLRYEVKETLAKPVAPDTVGSIKDYGA